MANYLITCAAGFIASRVAQLLLDQGHNVVGIDNLNEAYDVRMKHYRLERMQANPGFSFQQFDISDKDALAQIDWARADFAGVINLAARAGVRVSLVDPWVYMGTNLTGTLNLLEQCRQHGVPKFVLASTSSVYGENAPQPTPETADTNHPLQPYSASKKAAEVLCHAYNYLYGIDVTVVRYFTVYGPVGRPDMVMFRFAKWIREGKPVLINGDGEQSRGFTYLDDIARGTILALKPVGYEIINLGGHETITINRLLQIMEDKIGRKAQVEYRQRHPADMLSSWADVSKAGRLLGWEPQVDLEEGISRLVAWHQTEHEWLRDIRTE